ncbi:MAG TPA: recombinase family protein [Candidatus Acidoferrum sp.]|jgi:site-specific DNA recombinase|nr:recombinase family protein [Candidatus Acidoferrum sp.]
MSLEHKPVMRCAIYTRKSSEEGLEQSFNSLDAQRESSEAFILSQRQEGWRVVPTRYDDGGYSGGNMERPALKRLLEDVEARKVNVIVVYKVDRLTRSLSDFAKIVEALDARGVSFVSVTQQFNTTSSMGRLTLNILLSFAQFEREVTGERIRDKIAASKKIRNVDGRLGTARLWLDGRKLVPSAEESDLVCKIFSLYLKLGCVSKLAVQLDREKVRSKVWLTRTGARLGGVAFARGALYALLRNRLYIGEIRHCDHWYPGEHKGVVPRDLWDKVQAQLNSNLQTRRNRIRDQASSLLTGLVEDAAGNRFTPSFTIKRGRRYRYYVSQLAIKNPPGQCDGPTRVPAHELESRVIERLLAFLKSDSEVFDRLGEEGESPAISRNLVAAAKKLASRLPSLPSDDLRDLLAAFLPRVVIQENNIQGMISKNELRQLLDNGGKLLAASFSGGRKLVIDANGLIFFDHRGKEETVWRRSSSGCAAQLHDLGPTS